MDWFSHMFLPYALARRLGRPRSERIAVAVGAGAPDLDVLFSWIGALDPSLFIFSHRAITHTVWGAPAIALAVFAVLAWSRVAARLPERLRPTWTRASAAWLVAGALSHLLLDSVTVTGVPALWPLSADRVSLGLWSFVHPLMAVFSAAALVLLVWNRVGRRRIPILAVAVVVVLVASGAVRLATVPDVGSESTRVPGPIDGQWLVVTPREDGVTVEGHGIGIAGKARTYLLPNLTTAAAADEACRSHPSWPSIGWEGMGPPFANATARAAGGWNVTYTDPASRFLADVFGASRPSDVLPRGLQRETICQVGPDGRGSLRIVTL